MKNLFKTSSLLILITLIISSCSLPKEMGSKKYRDSMIGSWGISDDLTVIEKDNKSLKVSLVKDHDGEEFEIREYGWAKGEFYWIYYVPSTEYVVRVTTKGVDGDVMHTIWENEYDTGEEDLNRKK